MELDEYKIIIRQRSSFKAAVLTTSELEKKLRNNMFSVIDAVLRNLKLEGLFTAGFIALMAYAMVAGKNVYLQLFALFMIIYGTGFIYYLYALREKVRRYRADTHSVKDHLQQLIAILKRFTLLYRQLSLVMVPVILMGAFFYGYVSWNDIPDLQGDASFSVRAWIFFALSVAWYTMMYFFTRWYTRKLYGNHIEALVDQLNELTG